VSYAGRRLNPITAAVNAGTVGWAADTRRIRRGIGGVRHEHRELIAPGIVSSRAMVGVALVPIYAEPSPAQARDMRKRHLIEAIPHVDSPRRGGIVDPIPQ